MWRRGLLPHHVTASPLHSAAAQDRLLAAGRPRITPESLELGHSFLTLETEVYGGVISALSTRLMDAACTGAEGTNSLLPNAFAVKVTKLPKKPDWSK